VFRSTPDWLAAPSPRLTRFEAAAWLNVSVPFTVMLPLGPEIVELYLELSLSMRDVGVFGKYGVPFGIIHDQSTGLAGERERNGGI
jgi:hypothetical protein